MLICNECKEKIKFSGVYICGLCGCVLSAKTRLPEEKCLMNKW